MSSSCAVVVFLICFAFIEGKAFNKPNRHRRQAYYNATTASYDFVTESYTSNSSRYNATIPSYGWTTGSSNSSGYTLTTGSYELTTGSYDLTTGSYDLTTGSYNLTTGSYDLTTGSYNLTTGSYNLTIGSYDLTTAYCNVTVNAINGTLASPPNGYQNNMYCTYVINTPTPVDLHFFMMTFAIENEASCRYDALSFGGRKFCGHSIPKELVFRSNGRFVLTFTTDYSVTDKGFYLYFNSNSVQ